MFSQSHKIHTLPHIILLVIDTHRVRHTDIYTYHEQYQFLETSYTLASGQHTPGLVNILSSAIYNTVTQIIEYKRLLMFIRTFLNFNFEYSNV